MKYSLLIATCLLSFSCVASSLPSSLLNQVTDLENQGKLSEALSILDQYQDNNTATSSPEIAMAQALLENSDNYELVATNFYNLANLAHRLDDLSQSEYFYKKELEFDSQNS